VHNTLTRQKIKSGKVSGREQVPMVKLWKKKHVPLGSKIVALKNVVLCMYIDIDCRCRRDCGI